ncbi:hypothetical protein SK069_09880 [Patulibacter brassicae]|uniref:Uncharacterized protein n=1 Tax=Patulibacter brassicae TaxID=1705717 RepID=A0ABU4VJ87_9ACTN|nr:hypothetical protein [Patulibacter brassicae]MDX8151900.1 hypothetical protein [Patulibacter brassicae]
MSTLPSDPSATSVEELLGTPNVSAVARPELPTEQTELERVTGAPPAVELIAPPGAAGDPLADPA